MPEATSLAGVYSEIRRRGGIADLSERAKFLLTGADRVRFLNGQVSNDIRRASQDEAMYACVMSPKGKMSGDLFVSAGPDSLRLDAEPSLREDLAARLERYIISDDVTLEDVTDDLCLIHVFGENLPYGFSPHPGVAVLRSRRLGAQGLDLFVDRTSFPEVWQILAQGLPVADESLLEILRIEAGIPRWGRELTPDTIPVEAGLDKTAIDYNKGCYVGQEVISRLKSIGHVNKHLAGFVAETPLSAGMRLFAAGADREAGWLTSAAYSFGLETHAALGYLKRGFESEALTASLPGHAGGPDATPVTVRSLPLI